MPTFLSVRVPVGSDRAGRLLTLGLVIGFTCGIRTTFRELHDATSWVPMEFGLLIFMTGAGFRTDGDIVGKFKAYGLQPSLAGAVVTRTPVLDDYVVDLKLMRLSPVILLGCNHWSHD